MSKVERGDPIDPLPPPPLKASCNYFVFEASMVNFFFKSTVLGIKSSNCSLFVLYSCRYIIFIFYSINNYTSSFGGGG